MQTIAQHLWQKEWQTKLQAYLALQQANAKFILKNIATWLNLYDGLNLFQNTYFLENFFLFRLTKYEDNRIAKKYFDDFLSQNWYTYLTNFHLFENVGFLYIRDFFNQDLPKEVNQTVIFQNEWNSFLSIYAQDYDVFYQTKSSEILDFYTDETNQYVIFWVKYIDFSIVKLVYVKNAKALVFIPQLYLFKDKKTKENVDVPLVEFITYQKNTKLPDDKLIISYVISRFYDANS